MGGYGLKYKFKCQLCPKQFTGQHGLDYHMNVHNDLRPAVCPVCPNKAYRAFGDLNKHLRNHHPELVMEKEAFSPNLRNTQGESPQDRSKTAELASPTHSKVQQQRVRQKSKPKNNRRISPKCLWCPKKFATIVAARIHVSAMHRDKRDEFDKLYPPSERTLQTRKERASYSSAETTPQKRKIPTNTNKTNGFVYNYSSLESSPLEKEAPAISKSLSQNSKPVKLKSWTKFFTYDSPSTIRTPSSSSPSPQINLNDNLKNNNAEHSLDDYMDFEESNNNSEISCNYCKDIFYEQKYLDLHLKHWHKSKYVPNKKSLTPVKSQSRQVNEKKKIHPDNTKPTVENSASQPASKKEKVITKNEKTNLIESLDYSCPSCGRLFSSLGKLELHAAVHLRTKVFDCSMCRSSFQSRKELILHRLSIHQL